MDARQVQNLNAYQSASQSQRHRSPLTRAPAQIDKWVYPPLICSMYVHAHILLSNIGCHLSLIMGVQLSEEHTLLRLYFIHQPSSEFLIS